MGGMFSKKAKVAPDGGPPRTNSAPAAIGGLGRCSPENPQDAVGRPASAEDFVASSPGENIRKADTDTLNNRRQKTSTSGALAALRPFEKQGHDGKLSGVVPEGADAGRVLAADTSPAKGGPPRDAPLAEWNRVLGEDNVRMIFSSVWAERERGLRNVHSLIVARGGSDGGGIGGGGGASAAWRCVCGVLHTMAKDKVAPVYFAALEVLAAGSSIHTTTMNAALTRWPLLAAATAALARKAGAEAVHDGLDEVIPTLVSRAGNRNGRISASSIEAVVSLARDPAVGTAYVLDYVFAPVTATTTARDGGVAGLSPGRSNLDGSAAARKSPGGGGGGGGVSGGSKGQTVTALTGRLELLTKMLSDDDGGGEGGGGGGGGEGGASAGPLVPVIFAAPGDGEGSVITGSTVHGSNILGVNKRHRAAAQPRTGGGGVSPWKDMKTTRGGVGGGDGGGGVGGGVSSDRLVRFLVPALETPDDRVRSLAVSLLVRLYKMQNNGSTNCGNAAAVHKAGGAGGGLGALSDIIDRYALRLSPAMQKLLMRKLNAAGEEAAMDAAIENGDLEALLTPKKSNLSLPSLPPLSVSGRSALPPLSERRAMASSSSSSSKKRSAAAAVGYQSSSSSPSSLVLSSLSQNHHHHRDDYENDGSGFAGKMPLGHHRGGGSVGHGLHYGGAGGGAGSAQMIETPPQSFNKSARRNRQLFSADEEAMMMDMTN